MFWPTAPKADVAERLKSLGIDTVIFDPCETPPQTGDFLDTMRQNYRRLEEVFVSLASTPVETKRSRLSDGLADAGRGQGPGDADAPVSPRGDQVPLVDGQRRRRPRNAELRTAWC